MAQALVRFLASQHVERDGAEHRFIAGCFGIFGHGNLTGVGQALAEYPKLLTYYQARNEQAMVHTAAGFSRARNRLATFACTTSIGPGATNMVTGAAAATIMRGARRPLIVAGGGVIYSEATDALRRFVARTGVPVGETQAGKGSLAYDQPGALGALGATGTLAANRVAAKADVVLGV